MKFIDPYSFKNKDFPIICLVDDRRSFIGFAIKSHSKGNYSHIQEMIEPKFFASQQFTGFKKVPIETYMKPGIMLKFWQYDMNEIQKVDYIELVKGELKQPWWKKIYDFPGIFLGQLLPGKWTRKLNFWWLKYCSERVIEHINKIMDRKYPIHPTPSEVNQFLKEDENAHLLGYYFID